MAFDTLVSEITAAAEGPKEAFSSRVVDSLRVAANNPLFLPEVWQLPDNNSYARYLLYEDPSHRFSIFSLIWEKGQTTPVHAHHYWCAYAILAGTITENFYAYDAATDKAHHISTNPRTPGYACLHQPGLDIIHQLGNQDAQQAISLHVYGITDAEPRRRTVRKVSNPDQVKHINRIVDVI